MSMEQLKEHTSEERLAALEAFEKYPTTTHAIFASSAEFLLYYYDHKKQYWVFIDSNKEDTPENWIKSSWGSNPEPGPESFSRTECQAYVDLDQYGDSQRTEIQYILPGNVTPREPSLVFYKPGPNGMQFQYPPSEWWGDSNDWKDNKKYALLNPEYVAEDPEIHASIELEKNEEENETEDDDDDEDDWITEPDWSLALPDATHFLPESDSSHAMYFKQTQDKKWMRVVDSRYSENTRIYLTNHGIYTANWTLCSTPNFTNVILRPVSSSSSDNDIDNW